MKTQRRKTIPGLPEFKAQIDDWARQGAEAERKGDHALARTYARDVQDLRAVYDAVADGRVADAARHIEQLDTIVRDQVPNAVFRAIFGRD